MEMIKVESSNIDSIGYEGTQLYVKFKNGTEYSYDGVSSDVHSALMKAESKGKYFIKNIRNKYKYKKIDITGGIVNIVFQAMLQVRGVTDLSEIRADEVVAIDGVLAKEMNMTDLVDICAAIRKIKSIRRDK